MGEMRRVKVLLAAATLATIGLGGCARTNPPAPVEVKGQQRYDRGVAVAASARAVGTDPGVAVVQPGDTLFGIARKHDIPIRAVIDANRLEPPYALRSGQRLTLPRVRTHVVQAGETVNAVSRRYGVEANALVRANAIQPPYNIMAGQTLILPGAADGPSTVVARNEEPAIATSAPPAVPAGRVDSAPLPAPTGSPAGPPAIVSSAPASNPAARAPSVPAEAAPEPPAAAPAPVTTSAPATAAGTARAEPQRAHVEPASAALPARAGRAFQWPVRGRIVSDFGPKGGGMHNDGINIAASRGAPIRAAENGVVVYAGNELRGFGNLLLLRHADGWMTAYAHADEILVARGDQVKRGEVIGRVGSTGNVASPQIHFEIRRGSRAVNPRDHLAAETASSG
jgi:murein DD-endopeptidase MepM/ murein hydrolase activator NlpD